MKRNLTFAPVNSALHCCFPSVWFSLITWRNSHSLLPVDHPRQENWNSSNMAVCLLYSRPGHDEYPAWSSDKSNQRERLPDKGGNHRQTKSENTILRKAPNYKSRFVCSGRRNFYLLSEIKHSCSLAAGSNEVKCDRSVHTRDRSLPGRCMRSWNYYQRMLLLGLPALWLQSFSNISFRKRSRTWLSLGLPFITGTIQREWL